MSQENNEQLRDTLRFGEYDFEIHNLTEDGQNFPNYPFIIQIPFILFNQNQLQAFMSRFYSNDKVSRAGEYVQLQPYDSYSL